MRSYVCPYLFVMCMDKLTHLILEVVDSGDWTPLKAFHNGPTVLHLVFADDLLLFGKATEKCFQCVNRTLKKLLFDVWTSCQH